MKNPDNETRSEFQTQNKTCRILIVDDNQDAVEMMDMLLTLDGYPTRKAFDGETGIAIAKEFQPEICLCDIGLPEMSGYELAGYLRKLLPQSLLISISGWGQEEDHERSLKAGFDYHLVKPVQFNDLMKIITGHSFKTIEK